MKHLQRIKPRFFKIPKIVAWIFPRRIWFGPKDSVCLTFDDGPHPIITPWLLDELKKKNIKATFFWNGLQIEKHPELLTRAEKEGHVVGHHGYEHKSAKKYDFETFKQQFEQSRSMVNTHFYRPPYGDLNFKQARYALRQGEIVMWSWMSYDFDQNYSVHSILKKAKEQIQGGDVLVFHENDKTIHSIKEIIPSIIQIIRDKELNFAVVEKKQ